MHDTEPDNDDRTDLRLLADVAAGIEQAFVDLYRRRHQDVYRFVYALAKSRSLAQDVTQEVFLNVLENASRFDGNKGSVRAWLFGCARYVAIDRLRIERRWTRDDAPPEVAEAGHDERLYMDQRIERLHAAIAQLPFEYREALVLCELLELSYAEAAAALDCPIGTVRSRLHRGRALLASRLVEREEINGSGAAARSLRATEVFP
jgi:RNA polymerase sigma-70 factor (ECF subfamily)